MGILKVTSRFGLLLGFIALTCTAVSCRHLYADKR